MPEHQDSQAATASPDSREAQDQPDPKDHPEDPVNPALTVTPAHPVSPVNPEALARRESAPNTAPSMVESSSRMELDAVKRLTVFSSLHFSSPLLCLLPTAPTSYCHPLKSSLTLHCCQF